MNLYLFGSIDDNMVNRTIKKIVETPPEDPIIVVYINSMGGEGDCDYAIYEALKLSGKQIVTYAIHHCYSAAMTVYLAGDNRYAQKHSNFMIHEVYHDLNTEKKTIDSYRKNITELKNSTDGYFKLIANRTKLSLTRLKNFVKKAPEGDWFFDITVAKTEGIVMEIGLPVFPEFNKENWDYIIESTDDENETPEENGLEGLTKAVARK